MWQSASQKYFSSPAWSRRSELHAERITSAPKYATGIRTVPAPNDQARVDRRASAAPRAARSARSVAPAAPRKASTISGATGGMKKSLSAAKMLCNIKYSGKIFFGTSSANAHGAPGGPDQSLEVVEIALKGLSALRSQPVLGPRHASGKAFPKGDVAGLFEFAGMDREIPVGRRQQLL